MALKPETKYRMAVDKHIPKTVHKQSMGLAFNGTPDSYYEGDSRTTPVLWVEYKFTQKLRKDGVINLRDTKKKPFITGLQLNWAIRAFSHNIPIVFILGIGELKAGIIISLPFNANGRFHIDDFPEYSNRQMAEWITSCVMEQPPLSKRKLSL